MHPVSRLVGSSLVSAQPYAGDLQRLIEAVAQVKTAEEITDLLISGLLAFGVTRSVSWRAHALYTLISLRFPATSAQAVGALTADKILFQWGMTKSASSPSPVDF